LRSVEKIDLIIHYAAYLGDNKEEAEKSNVAGVDNIAGVACQVDARLSQIPHDKRSAGMKNSNFA
jgi:dTDP-4-dehydrorhamnose reductase